MTHDLSPGAEAQRALHALLGLLLADAILTSGAIVRRHLYIAKGNG